MARDVYKYRRDEEEEDHDLFTWQLFDLSARKILGILFQKIRRALYP